MSALSCSVSGHALVSTVTHGKLLLLLRSIHSDSPHTLEVESEMNEEVSYMRE